MSVVVGLMKVLVREPNGGNTREASSRAEK